MGRASVLIARSPLSAVGAACVALAVLLSVAPPAAATGGSFSLCYERLKQMADILRAQGSREVAIREPVDDPKERRYVLELTIGERFERLTCTRSGAIERLAPESTTPD